MKGECKNSGSQSEELRRDSGTLKFSNPVSTVKEETKHTPGPWKASFHGHICIGVQNEDFYGQMICNSILPETDEQYEKEKVEIEANMRLIASAPDLLKENQELKAIKAELVHEIEQLILHAEEDSLTYSVLEHARKLVYLKSKAQ
ncbi:MAG TPA: hypothetical protein VFZ33_01105 [Chitinophagaceae bacterium]